MHVSYVSPMLIVSVNINAPNSQHAGFGYIYLANDELNVGECEEERGRKGYDGAAECHDVFGMRMQIKA